MHSRIRCHPLPAQSYYQDRLAANPVCRGLQRLEGCHCALALEANIQVPGWMAGVCLDVRWGCGTGAGFAGWLSVSCCLRRAGSDVLGRVSDASGVPEDAVALRVQVAGLRAANESLRALLADKDAKIAGLEAQVAAQAERI